jgi:hypothetical protein
VTSPSAKARFAHLALSLGVLVVRSHPKYFSRFGLDLKLLAVARPKHQTMGILFIFGLSTNKMVVLLSSLPLVLSLLDRDGVTGSAKWLSLRLIQQLLRMTRGVRVTTALFFFACKFSFVCFVVDHNLGLEFAQSA